jgi:hypothetical protein
MSDTKKPYKASDMRFAAFLMCHRVPVLGSYSDGQKQGRSYCFWLFDLTSEEANRYWMRYQNKDPEFRVDAKTYAEEYENLKKDRHKAP